MCIWFGTIYSGFGVSGVFAFVHAWLHEVAKNIMYFGVVNLEIERFGGI